MGNPTKIRTQEDSDRFRLALVPVDQAMWASEQRWGVGRLERIISPSTLAAYKRGWDAYREALDTGDAPAVEAIGPKMIAALAFMSDEATAAGHQSLAPETWECPLGDDGAVLVLTRTQAEQSAVIRAEKNGTVFAAAPGGSTAVLSPEETKLPADLAVTVRGQHEGRALEVWTMAEVAALILAHGSVARDARKWQGTPAPSGVQQEEGAAADLARTGYPLDKPLAGSTATAVLDF